jgi:hypothetical protein
VKTTATSIGPGHQSVSVVSGGTFLGPVAGGYGAHATQVNQAMTDTERLARLQRLLRELEAGVRELDGGQQDEAVQAVVLLREEFSSPGRTRARSASCSGAS